MPCPILGIVKEFAEGLEDYIGKVMLLRRNRQSP